MTEWLREGIEGRSLKATLRLYLLGLMVLASVAAVLALVFGGQTSFVATPLLVFIVVAVEYAICYRARLRKDFEELLWKVRRLIDYKRHRTEPKLASVAFSNLETQVGSQVGLQNDARTLSRPRVRDGLPKEEKTFESPLKNKDVSTPTESVRKRA